MVALAPAHGLQVVAAHGRPGAASLGADAGQLAGVAPIGVPLTALPPGPAAGQVMIEVSSPAGLPAALAACRAARIPVVVGTTGLGAAETALLDAAAREIPVLQSTNFSLVVNVLWKLSEQAAKLLPGYDIEVMEIHHHHKKDAPSGTAMTLARRLCAATGRDPAKDLVFERHGEEALRKPNEITVQTLRLGDHPGEHTAYFAAPGERLEIKHVSTSRDSYVVGALKAAAWLAGKPAGRYAMGDVLGL